MTNPPYLSYVEYCPACIAARTEDLMAGLIEGSAFRQCEICWEPRLGVNLRVITKTVPYAEGIEILRTRRSN